MLELERDRPKLTMDADGRAWWVLGDRRYPVAAGGDDGDGGDGGDGKGGDGGAGDAGKGDAGKGGAGDQGGAGGGGDGGGKGGGGDDEGDDSPAARARREAKSLRDRLRETEGELKKLRDAGKSDLERTAGERDEWKGKAEAAGGELESLRVEVMVLRRASTFGIHDPDAAAGLLDRSLLELEDGKPTAKSMDAALRDLVKRKPYLTRGGTGDGGGGAGDRGNGAPDANQVLRDAIAAKKGRVAAA